MRVTMRPLLLVFALLVLAALCLAGRSDDMEILATLDLDSRFSAEVIASSLPSHQLTSTSAAIKSVSDTRQAVDMTAEPTFQDSTDFHLLQDALDENNNLLPSLNSGEGYRALGRARSLAAPKPEPATENTKESSANLTSARTSSPDIQDIITGFVKLLNTNAQTSQANRPQRTRINNRGPPRITDLVLPPPTKPPYPFQKPPLLSPPPVQSRPLPPHPSPPHYQPHPLPLPRPTTESPLIITTHGHEIFQENKQDIYFTTTTQSSKNVSNIDDINSNEHTNKNAVIKYGTVGDNIKNNSNSVIIIDNNGSISNNEYNNFILKHTYNISGTNSHHFIHQNDSTIPTVAPFNTSNIKIHSSIDSSQLKLAASKTTTNKIQPTSVLNTTVQSSTSSIFATIEPSIQDVSTDINNKPSRWHSTSLQTEGKYAPRPGIVLDDTEYKPGVEVSQRTPLLGDVFDVTVSAIQGETSQTAQTGRPFVYPVEVDGVNVITTAEPGQHFVSIDGKRTYINLLGRPTSSSSNLGTVSETTAEKHRVKPVGRPYFQRPTSPPVRIDTCIVGDDSTCDASQHEYCKTEFGVSSCHCRPGYNRRRHRESCHHVLSLVLSLKLSKLYEHQLVWSNKLLDRESHEFIQIEYEASRAIDSALSMTPYSDELLGSKVNNIYKAGDSSSVFVNLTIQLEDSSFEAKRRSEETLRQDMHYQLVAAIHRRGNNVGNSGLWVDNSQSAVSPLYDLDECSSPELHDCHIHAICINTFGSFQCTCRKGFRDLMAADELRSGRNCESCPAELCGHRGYCEYDLNTGQPVCKCLGNFYGAQCQIDGEVLGVAVGASLLAVIIIASTLACLCIWSRKWSREDDNMTQYGTHPYTLRGPKMPQYGVCLDERLRWAQMTDTVNHYAPEPVCRGPPLPPPPGLYGRGPPAQLSSSEDDDLHLLAGAPFHVPRPKSTSNESAIYWTAEYAHHTGPRMVTAQF